MALLPLPDWFPSYPFCIAQILLAVYVYITYIRPLSTFKRMGVPGPKPYPVIGNMMDYKNGFWDVDLQMSRVREFGGVYGFLQMMQPTIVVTDREFLREIFINQFDNFSDRAMSALSVRPLNQAVTDLRGEDWKNVRSTLRPVFTGGKLKLMCDILNQCADQLVENIAESTRNGAACEMKELASAFTMDATAAVAFGIDINSQHNPEHPFVLNAKKAFGVDLKNPLAWAYFLQPKLLRPILETLQISLTPRGCIRFFTEVVSQIMEQRQAGEKGRVDMIQLMMDAHKMQEEEEGGAAGTRISGRKQGTLYTVISKDQILANGFQFILSGYETTATTISFSLFQLATHPDVQDKVINELDDVMKDRDTVDYDACKQLEYMEMCIMESLRIWPISPRLARIAKADTKIQWLTVPKGTPIDIPVLPIHFDPERYPEPDKFIPERFSKEERQKRDPCDFLPFGSGPRNCIGMRLAMMEAKIALAKILMKYRVRLAPDMEVPPRLSPFSAYLKLEHGISLRVVPRNSVGE